MVLFVSPVFFIFGVLTGLYVYLDPFKVIWSYQSFYDTGAEVTVSLNRTYVSTTVFDRNYKTGNFNSFIFGNSRSQFYRVEDWKGKLPGGSNPFHFDGFSESLYTIDKKVEYIDAKGVNIKNALVTLDYSTLVQDKPHTGHLYIISPQLVNYTNRIAFHLTFLKAFLSPKFLRSYFDYQINGQLKKYMLEDHILDDRSINYSISTNEISLEKLEALIQNGEYYTPTRMAEFYERDTVPHFSPASIHEDQKGLLTGILRVFKKHNTNYRIIINPLYDQLRLDPGDLDYLKQLFGSNRVFDFSGINIFTRDCKNYYEPSHYRPHVAAKIISEVYKN